MASVVSRVSTLPGYRHALPDGARCDEHGDRMAIARVQGETDSFGAELHDLCGECWAKWQEEAPPHGLCGWCNRNAERLFARRDEDEGLYGPVYWVCRPCIEQQRERIQRELEDALY